MMRSSRRSILSWVAVATLSAAACAGPKGDNGLAGAKGDPGATGGSGKDGNSGKDGAAAPTTGTLAGVVADAVKKDMLAGVTVTIKDSGGTQLGTATTDATGAFKVDNITVGTVVMSVAKQYWTSPGDSLVGVLAGQTVNISIALSEAASGKPSVTLTMAGNDFGYGNTATINATAASPTGATLSYAWANSTVPNIGTVAGAANVGTVTLPAMTDAFARRLENPKTPLQYISGYVLPNRPGVVPILNDTRGEMSVALTVTDDRGQSATASMSLDAASIQTGNQDVAVGTRAYVNSGHDANNAWTLDLSGAPGSAAVLDSAAARAPS